MNLFNASGALKGSPSRRFTMLKWPLALSSQQQSGDICFLVTGPFRESDIHDGVLPEFPRGRCKQSVLGVTYITSFYCANTVTFLVFCTITLVHLHLLSYSSTSFWRPCPFWQIIQELVQTVPYKGSQTLSQPQHREPKNSSRAAIPVSATWSHC